MTLACCVWRVLSAAGTEDQYSPVFRLDFISINGQPLRPICRGSLFFDNITISFRQWRASYSAKHPTKKGVMQRSALARRRAETIASYITDVFLRGELLGEGVEPRWVLAGQQSKMIAFSKWSPDPFWVNNQPAFHAYDYGANIKIKVNLDIQNLEQEVQSMVYADQEDESEESDREDTANAEDDSSTAAIDANDAAFDYVSYALAVDVHCSTADQLGSVVCLLADRNQVMKEFYGSNYTFYPLGFHPAYGNFTSDSPPAFLDHNLFTIMKSNMRHQNQSADVLSFGFFQGYSNLKWSFRHRKDDLLASQGSVTAALTIPAAEAARTAQWRAKQQRLMRRVRGEQTPENPAESTPFAREAQRVEAFMAERAPKLWHILQPILQVMRLFLKEKQLYSSILRKFPPAVFPGALTAFARTIVLAIGEMDRRFKEGGSKGLGLTSSEGVAALHRLGNFCFTGDPRVLPSKVFGLLGTMEGPRTQGWPHISPRMLNLQKGKELLNLARWSRGKDGPASVAASRHSQLWFSKLGGQRIDGAGETIAFMSHQLHRNLSQGLHQQECINRD
ncbi:hypothetical protein GGI35DRAFT_472744 [Trichoderma velutinum]